MLLLFDEPGRGCQMSSTMDNGGAQERREQFKDCHTRGCKRDLVLVPCDVDITLLRYVIWVVRASSDQ